MAAVERRLKELDIPYIKRCVEEGGIYVDQIFFHDPDGFMIEICNCDNLPVVPLADQTFATMAGCKRVVAAPAKQQHPNKQQSLLSPPPTVQAPQATATSAVQCVPSAMQRVGGEEAHISCA
uniref:Uncharacterized protein n=1 Tax=Avena sativa TaxID=4498 RepID=A0ACD6ANY6_AVESA